MNTRVIKLGSGLITNTLAFFLLISPVTSISWADTKPDTKFYPWKMQNYAITKPFGGYKGNADRGRKIVINRDKGNCLACHALPIKEESFHGTVGPALHGIASRLSEGEIRLRVADEQKINPMTMKTFFFYR